MTASPTGIVRWAMAAFHANKEADDDELIEILVAAGLPQATRVVMMLPLAFGRRILDGLVTVTPTYFDDDRELALLDDPIFAAADHIARTEASREDLDRIGLHSSEVNAVNAALHSGSEPGDLQLSPPRMSITEREVPLRPEVQAVLDELVRAHGATLVLQGRQFPRSVTTGRVQLQLDIVTKIGEREINESFAGTGTTIHDALTEAIQKFTAGSLHVLLAVLERKDLGGDQVEWEAWGEFDACLGSLLRLWSTSPAELSGYLDAIKSVLMATNLPPEIHWIRTFIATDGTRHLGLDMLVDNHGWEPGETIARTWPWPVTENPYALRHFFMLVPSTRVSN